MNAVIPRSTASTLDRFKGANVRIVGPVTLENGKVTLDASGPVVLDAREPDQLQHDGIYQVVGKVQPDLSVKVTHADAVIADKWDPEFVERVVKAEHAKGAGLFC